jgi:hypothetical protein
MNDDKRDIATHDEVLRLLTAKARSGSVSAAIALERALRIADKGDDLEDELDRLMRDH